MAILDRKLLIFQTAAKLKHFSEAAAVLAMTQPNVTQQIAKLEQELGVNLFERNGRNPVLTPAGEALLAECDGLFAAAQELRRRVNNATGGVCYYQLGGTMTAGNYLLPELAADYMEQHLQQHLSLQIGNTDEITQALKMRILELALVEGPFDRKLFLTQKLCSDQLVAAALPGVLPECFSLGEYLRSGKYLVLREPGAGTRYYFDNFLRQHKLPILDPQKVLTANSFEAIKQLVGSGHGITVMSKLALQKELSSGELVKSTFSEGEITRELNFIYLPTSNLTFAERFISFCRSRYRERKSSQF